ncbi:MAG: PAS domain-containing sensor histidine kinase [Gemmatimonadetes bacterium]|nr:PAS domain-containing sensor histidine kinase [Gemmatimonadota bacterium]
MRQRALLAAAWVLALAAATAVQLALRDTLDKAHVTVLLFLVVLGASATGGRSLGFLVSGLAFLAFDFFFLLPYNTLAVRDPRDWIVLAGFGVAAFLTGQLFHRVRREAAESQRRAEELAAVLEERAALLERSRAAEQAAVAAKAKDEVLASLSHDLRTPITAIRALAHDLAAGGDDRALGIEEEADRLARLAGNVLDLSRLEAGAMRLDVQPNEVEDLVGAALHQLEGAHPGWQVAVALDAAHPLLFVRCDFSQALRVLVNLLDNACRHAPPGTAVELDVARDGATVRFRVSDRGPGLPAALRERLFGPYARGDATGGTGTGLGLSIAHRLAAAQGGSLAWVPRDGGGTTFEFRLPVAELSPEDA